MPEVEEHNFAFNNPNFVDSSLLLSNEESVSGEEEALINSLDLHILSSSSSGGNVDEFNNRNQIPAEQYSDSSLSRRQQNDQQNVKYRSTYAKLGAADMGVPQSPAYEHGELRQVLNCPSASFESSLKKFSTENTGFAPAGESPSQDDRLPFTPTNNNNNNCNGVDLKRRVGEFYTDEETDRNIDIVLAEEKIYESDNTYFNITAQSPPVSDDEDFQKRRTLIDSLDTMQNGYSNGAGHHFDHRRDVDDSPQDFRRNFAMIDQVARQGGAFPGGGGIQMRREGDTTVVTEHRDPFSMYWQLDKIKKAEEPPPPRRRPEVADNDDESTQIQSPDSHDSGIHVEYSRLSKPVKKLSERFVETPPSRDASPQRKLPPGWEKHEDPKGFSYYWHVDSGTVQRERPFEKERRRSSVASQERRRSRSGSGSKGRRGSGASIERPPSAEPPRQMVVPAQPPTPVIVERAFKQTTTKRRVENETVDDRDASTTAGDYADAIKLPVRFAVRSLGWTEIAEEDLTQERSSRAVNKAIVDLSTGRNDLIDNVSKWGDGKELIMELDDHDLRLMDPDSGTVLHLQPIHQIRVWGVGRDNGRDFAYVARDRNTRRFMCHVFRCDTPARTIANTLRDICKRIMLERRPNTLQTNSSNMSSVSGNHQHDQRNHHTPHNHHNQQHHHHYHQNNHSHHTDNNVPHSSSIGSSRSFSRDSFPTPMEEPKKVIRCHFLGVTQVPRATGIDVLNEAVDRLVAQVRVERWILVDVSIAPSTITVTELGGNQIAECRVRYLSFLGIGRDIKHCAFIMQTSSDSFMCYVFHVEPSAGAMAKTIEAACKLRYQKVLDAHGERRSSSSTRGWGDTIRDVFGSFGGRRSGRSSAQQYPR